MARSDLLIALVRAGTAGAKKAVRTAAEAIIAEERAKQHNVLADRLTTVIQVNGNGTHTASGLTETAIRGRDFIAEIKPRRRLDDVTQWLSLPPTTPSCSIVLSGDVSSYD